MAVKASLILLLLACIAMGVLRSPASRGVVGPAPMELSFWNGFTGPDGRTMLELLRTFNAENPGVQIGMQRIAWETYYNKLIVSAIDGRGPDVFVVPGGYLPRMRRAGILEPVDDLWGTAAALKQRYPPRVVDLVNFGTGGRDEIVGLPLDIFPQGLYCNARLLREAGVTNPDGSARPPRTGAEWIDAGQKVQANLAARGESGYGFTFGQLHLGFIAILTQFGGRCLDDTGRPTLDRPENVAALQFLVDLLQAHRVAAPLESGTAGWTGYRQQRVAMTIEGVYMVGDLKRLDGIEYVGAPVPQVGPRPGTVGDSHVLCIRRGISPARRAAAARFIRFLADHSAEWADAGQVPARNDVRASAAFRNMPVQAAFATQLETLEFLPRTPSIAEFVLYLNLACEQALRGRLPAAEALRQANQSYARYLENDRIERDLAGAAR